MSQEQSHSSLQQLRQLLSQNDDRGVTRAQALDLQVDRLLSWRISCSIPQLRSSHFDLLGLTLTIECLHFLLTQSSTSERRREARRKGLDLCDGLLMIWETFPEENIIVASIKGILKSWTKLQDQEAAVHLIRQSNLVKFLRRLLQGNIQNQKSPLFPLSLIKHLVFRVEGAHKEYLYDELAGVLSQSIESQQSMGGNELIEAAEYSSAILWSWTTEGSTCQRMAGSDSVWTNLRDLLQFAQANQQTVTQRQSISAIGTIIAHFSNASDSKEDSENLPRMPPVTLISQSWILLALIQAIQNGEDADSKRRSLRTIRCFSSVEWGRKFLAENNPVNEKPLLPLLLQVLRRPETGDSTIHVQVCHIFIGLSPSFGQDWISSWVSHMEVALIEKLHAPAKTDASLISAVIAALTVCIEQSVGEQSEQLSGSEFQKQLLALLQVFEDNAGIHESIAILLHRMTVRDSKEKGGDHKLRPRPVASSPPSEDVHERESPNFFTSNSYIPDTLCRLLSSSAGQNPKWDTPRRLAVNTLTLLVRHPDGRNKKRLADHRNLLTSLVNLCLVLHGPIKDEAKEVVLHLVPEL